MADPSIDCTSDYYLFMKLYAGLMVLIFPVGVPLIWFVKLQGLKERIRCTAKEMGRESSPAHLPALASSTSPLTHHSTRDGDGDHDGDGEGDHDGEKTGKGTERSSRVERGKLTSGSGVERDRSTIRDTVRDGKMTIDIEDPVLSVSPLQVPLQTSVPSQVSTKTCKDVF